MLFYLMTLVAVVSVEHGWSTHGKMSPSNVIYAMYCWVYEQKVRLTGLPPTTPSSIVIIVATPCVPLIALVISILRRRRRRRRRWESRCKAAHGHLTAAGRPRGHHLAHNSRVGSPALLQRRGHACVVAGHRRRRGPLTLVACRWGRRGQSKVACRRRRRIWRHATVTIAVIVGPRGRRTLLALAVVPVGTCAVAATRWRSAASTARRASAFAAAPAVASTPAAA